MKNRSILFGILFVGVIHTMNAQLEFAPYDGIWYENEEYDLTGSGPWESYLKVVQVEGDTVINGETYKRVDEEFLIQRGESIYLNKNGTDYLLYDFSVSAGDTVEYYFRSNWKPGELEAHKGVIAHVEEENVAGEILKRIDVEWTDLVEYEPLFSYYEVFGSIAGIIPNGWNPIPEAQYKWLRFYENANISFKTDRFRNRGVEACDITSSNKEINRDYVSVERTLGGIIVDDPNNEVFQVRVHDMKGREVLSSKGNKQIALSSGLWIVLIETGNGHSIIEKVYHH